MTEYVQKALQLRNLDDPDRRPLKMGDQARAEINAAIRAHDERLLGCPKPWLLERVTRLMVHFWSADTDERARESMLKDWVADLHKYPAWALDQVFDDWRRSNQWAPKISEIILRVEDKIEPDQRHAEQLRGVLKFADRAPGERRRAAPESDLPSAQNISPDSAPHEVKAEWASKLVAEAVERLKA